MRSIRVGDRELMRSLNNRALFFGFGLAPSLCAGSQHRAIPAFCHRNKFERSTRGGGQTS